MLQKVSMRPHRCVYVSVPNGSVKAQSFKQTEFQFILLLFSILLPLIVYVPLNRYENLKGKYYELKRAEMNGEQRPQWLYWKEMDYIVNQMPSHKLRTNLDHRIKHLNNSTLNSSTEQNRSTTSLPELRDTKPFRLSSMQSQDSMGESGLLVCLSLNFSLCLF